MGGGGRGRPGVVTSNQQTVSTGCKNFKQEQACCVHHSYAADAHKMATSGSKKRMG